MQNPLSSSCSALEADDRTEHNSQTLTNPLTRNSQSADPAELEPADARETREQIEVPSKPVDLHGNKDEATASSEQDADVGVRVDETPRKGENQKRPPATNPSIEPRTTSTPTTTPPAPTSGPDTTNNGNEVHEIERMQAAESLLNLSQSKPLKRKRPVSENSGRRASLAKRNEDSDEIEYLGTRRMSGPRPLPPRPEAAHARNKRRFAEQEHMGLDGLNPVLSNRFNQHATPMGAPASNAPIRPEDLVLFSRFGLSGHTAVRAPSLPARYANLDAQGPSAPLGYPPAELRHRTHHQQHLGQGPLVGRHVGQNGHVLDWVRSSQEAVFPELNAGLGQADLFAYPRRPESAFSNISARNPLLSTSSSRPGSARPAPTNRNPVLPLPTPASGIRYASLPPSFGALYLARRIDGNRSTSAESANRSRRLAYAHAVTNVQQQLDVDHWKSRHLQKWNSLGVVHDGSGDRFANRLRKLRLPPTVPPGQKKSEAAVAAADPQDTKMEDVEVQLSPTAGDGEELGETVANKSSGDIQ
ncbi:hypothetical protein BST61_g10113 [Cercospora zeina]